QTRISAAEVLSLLKIVEEQSYIAGTPVPVESRARFIGRHNELVKLRANRDKSFSGTGSMVLIAGEPGIGKTALVEAFLGELVGSRPWCAIGRGMCSERLARTEAYLPVLEALEQLAPKDPFLGPAMKRLAPNWYAQITRAIDEPAVAARLKPTSKELLN